MFEPKKHPAAPAEVLPTAPLPHEETVVRPKERSTRLARLKRKMLGEKVTEDAALNEEVKRLEPVIQVILSKVFHQGIKKEDITSLIAFSKIKIDTAHFSDLEKADLEKLRTEDTPLTKKIALKWGNWVENSYNDYKIAEGISRTKLSNKTEKKAPSTIEKAWEWMNKNPIPTIVTLTAIGVGTYLIFSGGDNDGPSKEKSWFSKKRIFGTVLALGGILGLAGFDKIKEFCKKIADIGEEKWDKFYEHLKAGNIILAIKCIFEGSDNHYQYYKQLAEKISQETGKQISAKTIQSIANAKCADFTSKTSEGLSYALGKAKDVPYLGAAVTAAAGTDHIQRDEENVLREYLKKHADKIPKGGHTTVFEALTAAADISPLSSVSPEKQKPMIDAVDTGKGEAIGINNEIAANIVEKFKDKPHLKAFFDKYSKNWNEAILKSHNFWKELLEACHLDQVGLLLADNKVILVDGENVFCITDSPTLYKTAQEVINAGPAADTVGWSNTIQNTVIEGLGICVVVGAGFGGVKNLFTHGKSFLGGVIKGGFKGLLFPLKAVNPYNLQTAYRGVRGAEFMIKRTFAEDAAKIEILKNEAKFHAEIGKKYHDLLRESASGRAIGAKKWYAQWGSERIEKLRDKHTRLFAEAYNELQKAQGITDPAKTLETIEGKSKSIPKETIGAMEGFLTEQHGHELKALDNLGKSLADPLERAKFEQLPDGATKIKALGEISDKTERYMEDVLAKTREMQKAGRSEADIKAFQKEAENNLKGARDHHNEALAHLKSLEKDMNPAEKKAFQKLIETKLAKANGVRGILREIKGRGKFALVFGAAHIVWDVYQVSKKEKEEHVKQELVNIVKEIGLDTLQLVLDILSPFGVSDWYTVATGKEWLTGKKATNWDIVTRVVFGTYNLATDTLAAIGGAATVEVGGAGGVGIYAAENAVEASIRAAGKGPEVYRAIKSILPKLATLAKDSGGYSNLLKILKSEKTINALRQTKKVAGVAQTGILGIELGKAAYAGYHIIFDTKGQPEHILEMEPALPKAA